LITVNNLGLTVVRLDEYGKKSLLSSRHDQSRWPKSPGCRIAHHQEVAVTIEQAIQRLRESGPTMDVTAAAEALGVSRNTLYTAVKIGQAPVRTIKVLGRIKVLTASVIELLEGGEPVRSGETAPHSPRSEAGRGARTGSSVKRAESAAADAGAA
jgi:predicted DNA-binding protein (UPF0251 family)